MNTRNRNMLTVALASALIAPFAAASGLAGADPRASAQTETTQSELDEEAATEALPPQVNPVEEREQDVDPRAPIDYAAEDPMSTVPPPPPPVQSRDATQAPHPSDVAQDARWTDLDTDGDGRISVEEGAMAADFGANFEMMDGDGDGFVTEAEFSAHAMANPPRDDDSAERGAEQGYMQDDVNEDGGHDMDRDEHKDSMMDHGAMGDDAMDDQGTDDDMDDDAMDGADDDWNEA